MIAMNWILIPIGVIAIIVIVIGIAVVMSKR